MPDHPLFKRSAAENRDAAGETAALRFQLKRPPFLTVPYIAALVAAAVVLLLPWLGDLRGGAATLPGLVTGVIAYAVIAAAICAFRAAKRPVEGPVIELRADHAVLPVSSGSKRVRRVEYREISSLSVFGRGRIARVLVATMRRNFVYPVASFETGRFGLATFLGHLRARIAASPSAGVEKLREIDERDARGASAVRRGVPVAIAMLAVIGVLYVWTWLAGALDDPFGLIAFGANAPALVADGEWYRLLAANFLHANVLHLYLNGFGLLILGLLLERLIGSPRFLCIYLLSAAAGAGASTLMSQAALSVGASTAIFGLLGAMALVNWRFRDSLPGGFSQPLRWWLIILGLNAVLPVLVPMIDWAAHAGGFAAGALAAAVLVRDRGTLFPKPVSGSAVKALAVALCLVYAVALAAAFSPRGDDAARLRIVRSFVEQNPAAPAELNNIAWEYAIKPQVTASELAFAEAAATEAVTRDPANAAFLDTLATLMYRSGDFNAAVATQRRAVRLDPHPMLVSQMGRFLDARVAREGAVSFGGADTAAIEIALAGPGEAGSGGSDPAGAVLVDLPRGADEGLEIYALDKQGDELIGTLRVQVGGGVGAGRHRIASDRTAPRRGRTVRLVTAYADASGCDCPPGTVRSRYTPMSAEVRELPSAGDADAARD